MAINEFQLQGAPHKATQVEQMVVRQQERVSPYAHLLKLDSLVAYQFASMGRVNQYGIIPKRDPSKLNSRGVVWQREALFKRTREGAQAQGSGKW
jgi:hypothetical protein